MALVSVIIPTTQRPHLVPRAIGSVLAQTHDEFEIIVVVDGPNEETLAVLAAMSDPRLRVLHNPQALGAGPARNKAAAVARGDWLAFLDDDDEWLPEKLELQLAMATPDDPVLICSRCRIVTRQAEFIWPRRLYRSDQPIDEYLFDRRTFLRGDNYLGTATFLIPRQIFMRAQFGTTAQNEDTTLLLRLTKELGGRVVMLPDVLAVIYTEQGMASLGTVFSWRDALVWLDASQKLMTRRAYSGFCLVTIVSQAVRQRDYAAFGILLGRAFKHGSPTLVHLMLFLAFWIVPVEFRRRIRACISASRVQMAS